MPKSERDVLDILRKAYTNKNDKQPNIKQKGNELFFQKDIRLSLQTETAWKSTKTSKQYNLGSLWLCLEHHLKRISSISEYYKKVSELRMDQVGVVDAEEIIKYFTGQISHSQCINSDIRAALIHKAKLRDKPPVGCESIEVKGEKKVKTQMKLDEQATYLVKCIEYLNNYEKPMSSKSRCLKYPQNKFSGILTHLIQNQNNQQRLLEQNKGKPRIVKIYEKKRLPIIIVPQKTIPGNISIENIQKFLINGEYDEMNKLSNPQISKIQIEKQIRGKNIVFQVNSRPELLSEKDWEFVVVVFVLGRENQFDTWSLKSHKKVFENSLGYLIKFPKSQSGSASQWKCFIKLLDPISRVGDQEIARLIWVDIENLLFAKN